VDYDEKKNIKALVAGGKEMDKDEMETPSPKD